MVSVRRTCFNKVLGFRGANRRAALCLFGQNAPDDVLIAVLVDKATVDAAGPRPNISQEIFHALDVALS
jgi:hypothetical protein